MIVGEWSPFGEASVGLTVRGPGGQQRIRAVIDTGFDGWLSLPPGLIRDLGLPAVSEAAVELADGRVYSTQLHEASVQWDGSMRLVTVDAAPTEPLLGTELLWGYELRIHYTDGGRIEISNVP